MTVRLWIEQDVQKDNPTFERSEAVKTGRCSEEEVNYTASAFPTKYANCGPACIVLDAIESGTQPQHHQALTNTHTHTHTHMQHISTIPDHQINNSASLYSTTPADNTTHYSALTHPLTSSKHTARHQPLPRFNEAVVHRHIRKHGQR